MTDPPAPILGTDRLALEPMPPAAARALLAGERREAGRLLSADLPDGWPALDLLDVLPMQAAASATDARYGVWVMVEHGSRAIVGDIGFMGAPDIDGTVEIGYRVVPDRRRQGIATEAAATLVAWALAQPGVAAVRAECADDNLPSIRTLERLGFRRTGHRERHLLWRRDAGDG